MRTLGGQFVLELAVIKRKFWGQWGWMYGRQILTDQCSGKQYDGRYIKLCCPYFQLTWEQQWLETEVLGA